MNSSQKQKIAKSFGQNSSTYDQQALLQKEIAARLSGLIPKKRFTDILELGCGTGFLTFYLIEKFRSANLHITDLSEDMVNFCAGKFPDASNIQFECMDAEQLPIGRQYDLIISSMTFQWFANPETTIENLKKGLRPGGILLFSSLGPKSFPEWTQASEKVNIPHKLLTPDFWPGIFEEELITQQYKNGLSFLRHLKSIGAHGAKTEDIPLTSAQLRRLIGFFDCHHKGTVTWHIVYGRIQA